MPLLARAEIVAGCEAVIAKAFLLVYTSWKLHEELSVPGDVTQ